MFKTRIEKPIGTDGSQLTFCVDLEASDVTLTRRGMYTAVSMDRTVQHGEPGDPALPWLKFLASVPQNAQVDSVSISVRSASELAHDVLIEPLQPSVPTLVSATIQPVEPNTLTYERVATYPPAHARVASMRTLGGFKMVELEVCALRYYPAERRLELLDSLSVTLRLKTTPGPQLRRAPTVAAHTAFEMRTIARVKARVVNPEDVRSRLDLSLAPSESAIFPVVPYVIVTSSALASSFKPLATWRATLGLNARVVSVEDIQANDVPDTNGARFFLDQGYADGGTRDPAEAIRNFLKWANQHWQTEYVVLGGDTNVVPARYAWSPLWDSQYLDIQQADTGVELARTASASSSAPGTSPEGALDNAAESVWSPAPTDASPWIATDLMIENTPINLVRLTWAGAAATAYDIETSPDGTTWQRAWSTTNGNAGTVDVPLPCTSARCVRVVFHQPPGFRLQKLSVFGPRGDNSAYAISPTCTRLKLRSYLRPNPANSPDGDQLVITQGNFKGRVIPYDTAANDLNLGFRFVDRLIGDACHVVDGYTGFLEIRGPAAFHGASVSPKNEETYIPTDLYYSDLDSPHPAKHDWDADDNMVYGERYGGQLDGVNGLADIRVGRLSVVDAQQAQFVCKKVIQYERYRELVDDAVALPSSFATSAVLAAQNWYAPGAGYLDGAAACNEDIRHVLLASGTPWTISRLYEDRLDVAATDVAPDLVDASQVAIKAAIARGSNVVSLVSHGSPDYLCYLSQSDVDDEASRPSIWYANACSTNRFDGMTMSESAIRNVRGGAVAYVGNSRYGWTSDGPMERAFWQEMLTSGCLGQMLESAHGLGGDWQKYSLNLMGDPAMQVFSATPLVLTVAHTTQLFAGPAQPVSITVSVQGKPLPGATVCLSSRGTVLAVATTNASGLASLSVAVAAPTQLTVGVSARNVIPYVGSINVLSGRATMSIQPTSLNFGIVLLQRVSNKTLSITSTGLAPLTFSIAAPKAGSHFHWKPLVNRTLTRGQTYTHDVAYAPLSPISEKATLTLTSNTGTPVLAVSLMGRGLNRVDDGCEADFERTERCWINGRAGYRRVTCENGVLRSGPCIPGQIP